MDLYTRYACMYASNTSEMTPKLDFNTKILLTSRIMHRFQRFLVFWKAEGLLFHLETTFPRCFVFVSSKTWHLWKVCLIYWTNAGSSIPVLVKYLSQNTGNTKICQFHRKQFVRTCKEYKTSNFGVNRSNIDVDWCIQYKNLVYLPLTGEEARRRIVLQSG